MLGIRNIITELQLIRESILAYLVKIQIHKVTILFIFTFLPKYW